ncbi:MAG: hypothetical protein IJL42_05665 [Bacteroidales bacterium]|nr:hypothetical protein [Bacteroidales bacterium]
MCHIDSHSQKNVSFLVFAGLKKAEMGRDGAEEGSPGLKWEETGQDGAEEGSPGLKWAEMGRGR